MSYGISPFERLNAQLPTRETRTDSVNSLSHWLAINQRYGNISFALSKTTDAFKFGFGYLLLEPKRRFDAKVGFGNE